MEETLNDKGLEAIQEVHQLIQEDSSKLVDSITFDNDQRSIVRVLKGELSIYESYFPTEVVKFLECNGYLIKE